MTLFDGKLQGVKQQQQEPILIWRFEDAPEPYKAYSDHGGDEDWLAILPVNWPADNLPLWMEEGRPFGCCAVHEFRLPTGQRIVIGAHS